MKLNVSVPLSVSVTLNVSVPWVGFENLDSVSKSCFADPKFCFIIAGV